ncbi:hypothetical protein BJV78DRAFT_1201908 [Lactifluus subvellereus]|nr:hypothetical protein BJV78DRAFT_1201908 [Lactifluus subvellereus]
MAIECLPRGIHARPRLILCRPRGGIAHNCNVSTLVLERELDLEPHRNNWLDTRTTTTGCVILDPDSRITGVTFSLAPQGDCLGHETVHCGSETVGCHLTSPCLTS